MEYVIDNIVKFAKKKGFSHENMAFDLGISQPAYTKLLQNKTKLTVERLYKIAEILEVPVAELLGIEYQKQFNQTNKDYSLGQLFQTQQIENFYQENKEQYQKIIDLYEQRLRDKDTLIELLRAK